MSNAVTTYQPSNMNELYAFVERVTRTQLVPRAYQGKPEEAAVAIMYGAEHGVKPLASLQHVAVINGKPGFYGDAIAGVALMSGAIKAVDERIEGEGEDMTAVCVVTRADGGKVERKFSVKQAKKAGLWGKAGPWVQYAERMLAARARGFAVRDAAPHAFLGYTVEELRDIDEQPHVGAEKAKDVTPQQPANDVAPVITQEPAEVWVFDHDNSKWAYGATIREALGIYGDLKKHRENKVGVALANLDLLRSALDVAPAGSVLAGKLQAEIEAAEALTDAMDGMHAEPAEPVREAA